MERLDLYLTKNNFVQSRSLAQEIIKNNQVVVNGKIVVKTGYAVKEEDVVEIKGEINPFVSRGGVKLQYAVSHFNVDLKNKVVIDIGASTGGFTDCCLQNGAKKVYSIDVGTAQLVDKLRQDARVISIENTDIRNLRPNMVNDATIAVADVSFISLTKIADAITNLNLQELVFLIKPQFECGLEIAKRFKGVINDEKIHQEVINRVLEKYKQIGYSCKNIDKSPIKGGDGNVEYVVFLVKD